MQRNGGFVAKYMGDGVLAYFGYPQAHEDDAERAVEAGLALVEAVPKLNTVAGVPLSARVGIATGLVVVGDLIGTGAAQERAVVGEAPNLAARLQSVAEAGAMVIADSTRALIGNLFECRASLGGLDLKGFPEPVPAGHAVLRASARWRAAIPRRGEAGGACPPLAGTRGGIRGADRRCWGNGLLAAGARAARCCCCGEAGDRQVAADKMRTTGRRGGQGPGADDDLARQPQFANTALQAGAGRCCAARPASPQADTAPEAQFRRLVARLLEGQAGD